MCGKKAATSSVPLADRIRFALFQRACAEVSCKTFEELKAKGVEFVSEPKDQFYGWSGVQGSVRELV